MTGRFAPSPTGSLHVGNLRTALLAWLLARSSAERRFLIRVEDLDRANSSLAHEARQLADLAAIGLDWDPPVVRQSARFDRYDAAIDRLAAAGLTYECFCSRREIREAIAAPHVDDAAYPGTCRDLTPSERAARRVTRPPAIRLRSTGDAVTLDDALAGTFTGVADDVVLRRNDGVPAYNLAVVVDDADQGVSDVVRGDDLLSSTPRQVVLQRLLGLPAVRYAHVPLVVGADGHRLAKRDGAVTLADLATEGIPPDRVVAALARSLGLSVGGSSATAGELVDGFELGVVAACGRRPVTLADLQRSWS